MKMKTSSTAVSEESRYLSSNYMGRCYGGHLPSKGDFSSAFLSSSANMTSSVRAKLKSRPFYPYAEKELIPGNLSMPACSTVHVSRLQLHAFYQYPNLDPGRDPATLSPSHVQPTNGPPRQTLKL